MKVLIEVIRGFPHLVVRGKEQAKELLVEERLPEGGDVRLDLPLDFREARVAFGPVRRGGGRVIFLLGFKCRADQGTEKIIEEAERILEEQFEVVLVEGRKEPKVEGLLFRRFLVEGSVESACKDRGIKGNGRGWGPIQKGPKWRC